MAAAKKAAAKPRKSAAPVRTAKKSPGKKAAAPRPATPKATTKAAAPKPERSEASKPAVKPPKRDPSKGPVQKTRVVIPMDVYEPQKDAIKAPFKAHELKWNFLGEGKGLYKRLDNGVHCFTQFKEDGVHYSIWGDDKPRVEAILAVWKGLLGESGWTRATTSGEAAAQAEVQQAESEAMRLWKMQEPQARPGEPEFFLKKRQAEWLAQKPGA